MGHLVGRLRDTVMGNCPTLCNSVGHLKSSWLSQKVLLSRCPVPGGVGQWDTPGQSYKLRDTGWDRHGT